MKNFKKVNFFTSITFFFSVATTSIACDPKLDSVTNEFGNTVDIYIDDSNQEITPRVKSIIDWLKEKREGKGPDVFQVPMEVD